MQNSDYQIKVEPIISADYQKFLSKLGLDTTC